MQINPYQPMSGYNTPMSYQQYGNYNPYIQQQRGYQQQEIPVQQYQPVQQQIGINGKIIQTVENITANDVPMDGSVAFFPKNDLSEIYAKKWNSDGTICTVLFKPILNNKSTETVENPEINSTEKLTKTVMERFDALEKRIDDFMNKSTQKQQVNRSKKEETE